MRTVAESPRRVRSALCQKFKQTLMAKVRWIAEEKNLCAAKAKAAPANKAAAVQSTDAATNRGRKRSRQC